MSFWTYLSTGLALLAIAAAIVGLVALRRVIKAAKTITTNVRNFAFGALEAIGMTRIGAVASLNLVSAEHSWVRHAETGLLPFDKLEWCQYCGCDRAEGIEYAPCVGLEAIRSLRRSLNLMSTIE